MTTRYVYKAEGLVPSVKLIRRAQVELEILLNKMSLGNLQQDKRRVYLVDGSVIEVESMFGNHQVTLTAGKQVKKEKKGILSVEQSNDTYLLRWVDGTSTEGDSCRYIAYTPATNKARFISFPVYHDGPAMFDAGYAFYNNWNRDFISSSSPLRGWPGYAFIVCVSSSTMDAEGAYLRYMGIVSLVSRKVIGWFALKGWNSLVWLQELGWTAGCPADSVYVFGYDISYDDINKRILIGQEVSNYPNIVTTLGKGPGGELAILNVNYSAGYEDYNAIYKTYNPYDGRFKVVNPYRTSVITAPADWMTGAGGLGGDGAARTYTETVRTVCTEMDYDETFIDTCTASLPAFETYPIGPVGVAGSKQGKGAILFVGWDIKYFPIEVIPEDSMDGWSGTCNGDYDWAVVRPVPDPEGPGWIGTPAVTETISRFRTHLRFIRNAAADILIRDLTMQLQPGVVGFLSTIGSAAAWWRPITDLLYPSGSHAVGHNTSMMFTKDINGVKVYLQKLPQLGVKIPKLETENIDETDVDLTVPASQANIKDRPWIDITTIFRNALIALDPSLNITTYPTRPSGLVIYSITE